MQVSGKHLINLSIFTVLYLFLYFSVNALAVFSPFLVIILVPISIILAAIPYMLFLQKIEQFGVITMMAMLLSVFAIMFGDYPLTALTAFIAGFLADLIATHGREYKVKLSVPSYAIFSLWHSGAFLPFIFLRDSVLGQIEGNFGVEYAQMMEKIFEPHFVAVLLVLCITAGIWGAKIAERIVEKHFYRAKEAW